MRCTVTLDRNIRSKKKNRPLVRIKFERKPAASIRRMIGKRKDGGVGFRWNKYKYNWTAYENDERTAVAARLLDMGDKIPEDTS